ncbi:MAG: hypothetical protein NTW13_02585, partial [Candidatus Omnitrophica bacterium]|nr:hypothetical protein [Candidatus Omnitrophota bacterium]
LIYKQWDYALGKNTCLTELTKPRYDVKILTSVLAKKNLSLIESGHLFNSLEQVTIRLYPEVKRIKEKLAGLGLNKILMSGSGPAVFAIVSSGKEALSLSRKIKREERSWAVFAVSTR